MDAFFASGRVVDLALALVALEGAALILWRWRSGRGPGATALLANLAAGAALMLALRAALTGAGWPVVAAWLTGAGLAHGLDIALRLSRSGAGASAGTARVSAAADPSFGEAPGALDHRTVHRRTT